MLKKLALSVMALSVFAVGGFGLRMAATAVEPDMGFGPAPRLPDPQHSIIPTVNIATAKQWPKGAKPQTAEGLSVAAFAADLSHPRWLYTLPNGDVLVAETNAPKRPDDGKGFKGWVMRLVMSRAGAGVASENRIILLRARPETS